MPTTKTPKQTAKLTKEQKELLLDLLNQIYWQGCTEGSEMSCGIDENHIVDVENFLVEVLTRQKKEIANQLSILANEFEKEMWMAMQGMGLVHLFVQKVQQTLNPANEKKQE